MGLNVVIEDESEYVFVAGVDDDDIDLLDTNNNEAVVEHHDDDIDWDEGSYDNCDLSPSLSCATSVATNVTLKDLNLTLTATATTTEGSNSMTTMMVLDDPMDVDEDCGWNSTLGRTDTSATAIGNAEHFFAVNHKSGRRLSNKKLRKRMQNMKKAAAARALAEQKAAATNATTAAIAAVMSNMSSSSSSEDEIKMQQKKPRAVSIDCS